MFGKLRKAVGAGGSFFERQDNVIKFSFFALFTRSEERAVERSNDRVSPLEATLAPCPVDYARRECMAVSTHPDLAALVDPLFAARKEGKLQIFLNPKTLMQGREHTPATTQANAPPLKRGIKKALQIAALLLFSATAALAQPQFKGLENLLSLPKSYVVGYTKTAPVIDGDITDASWQQAKWTDDFVDIEGNLKPAPPLKTNIKMLWDDTCLYIAAQVSDPNVWAYLKKHDDIVFQDNDVELFIDPNNTTHRYFEIECNPINTIFDLFLDKPYRNMGRPLSSWDAKGMRSAVKVQGTLNDPSDTDKGWTMEMAIPFKTLATGDRRQVIREGTVWRINFSRVEWDTKVAGSKYEKLKDATGRNLPEHNWVWSPQGVINMHYPERWGYLQFAKNAAGDTQYVVPYTELQKQYLWLAYYKQRAWVREHGVYALSLKELDISPDAVVNGNANELKLEATPHQFMALITDKKDNITYTINQDGFVTILAPQRYE